MKKLSLKTKIISAAVVGCMVLTAGVTVFANDSVSNGGGKHGGNKSSSSIESHSGNHDTDNINGGKHGGQKHDGTGDVAHINKSIDTLKEEGIILEEEVQKIKDYIAKEEAVKKEKHDKLSEMTQEERTKYIEENKGNTVNVIDKMVEDKVITEEQGKEISVFLGAQNTTKHEGNSSNRAEKHGRDKSGMNVENHSGNHNSGQDD